MNNELDNSVYVENGYKNRDDYLTQLSEEYEIDLDIVYELAEANGPNEDFDGLITSLEDYYA
jgi:hypothetical protein